MFGLIRSSQSASDWSSQLPRLISVVLLFLLFPVHALAQSAPPGEQPPLLEVFHRCSRMPDCDSWELSIYPNGTFVFAVSVTDTEKPGPPRRVKHREGGQLIRDKLALLARLIQEPDFQNEATEYVATRVIDEGSLVTIVARIEKVEKRVTVYNYAIASDAEKAILPPSILKILELSVQVP